MPPIDLKFGTARLNVKRHCEERSDEAIHDNHNGDCFTPSGFAMTANDVILDVAPRSVLQGFWFGAGARAVLHAAASAPLLRAGLAGGFWGLFLLSAAWTGVQFYNINRRHESGELSDGEAYLQNIHLMTATVGSLLGSCLGSSLAGFSFKPNVTTGATHGAQHSLRVYQGGGQSASSSTTTTPYHGGSAAPKLETAPARAPLRVVAKLAEENPAAVPVEEFVPFFGEPAVYPIITPVKVEEPEPKPDFLFEPEPVFIFREELLEESVEEEIDFPRPQSGREGEAPQALPAEGATRAPKDRQEIIMADQDPPPAEPPAAEPAQSPQPVTVPPPQVPVAPPSSPAPDREEDHPFGGADATADSAVQLKPGSKSVELRPARLPGTIGDDEYDLRKLEERFLQLLSEGAGAENVELRETVYRILRVDPHNDLLYHYPSSAIEKLIDGIQGSRDLDVLREELEVALDKKDMTGIARIVTELMKEEEVEYLVEHPNPLIRFLYLTIARSKRDFTEIFNVWELREILEFSLHSRDHEASHIVGAAVRLLSEQGDEEFLENHSSRMVQASRKNGKYLTALWMRARDLTNLDQKAYLLHIILRLAGASDLAYFRQAASLTLLTVYVVTDQSNRAILLGEKMLAEFSRENFNHNHQYAEWLAKVCWNMGRAYAALPNAEMAEDSFRLAANALLSANRTRANQAFEARIYFDLFQLFYESGDLQKAAKQGRMIRENIVEAFLDSRQSGPTQKFPVKPIRIREFLELYGDILLALGNVKGALDAYDHARRLLLDKNGNLLLERAREYARIDLKRVDAYVGQGNYAQAKIELEAMEKSALAALGIDRSGIDFWTELVTNIRSLLATVGERL
ncbi:MAG: hypothetical protein Q7S68_03535 [Deltaproteobacteria bacterium]|nr:hypothetical protein [Deltaproteobacteria bacterium]